MANAKKLLILLLVALVLGGGYFAAAHFLKDDSTEETPTEAGVAVEAMQTDEVVGIEYLAGDKEIRLVKDGEQWVLDDDRSFPVNQAYPATMAADAAKMTAKRLVSESKEDFAEYGLSEPAAAYVFTLSDGSKVTYFIGNYNSYGDSYYMNVAGTEKIYLISAEFLADFDHDLTTLAEVEEMRTASTDEVTKMTLTLDGKTTTLFYQEDGLPTVYSRDFTWFSDSETPADAVAARKLVGDAVSYTSTGCGNYKATEAQLSEYGLDAPVLTLDVAYTVTEEVETGELDEDDLPVTETKTADCNLKLTVGKQADDGSYYAKLADSPTVYLIDGQYIDTLRGFDYKTLRSADVCAVRMADITSVDVTLDGKISKVTLERTKQSDGSESIRYTLDGVQITATEFSSFYSSIQGMTAEGFADKATTGNAAITVTYHTSVKNFETMTLQFIPYDTNFYVTDLNGRREVLVNKRDVESVCKAFRALQAQ